MRAKSTVLCALFVFALAANAFAGGTYNVNTSPLNAVRNGVAEVMGPITLNVSGAPAPTAINTNDQIQIIFPGAAIANGTLTGVDVTLGPSFPLLPTVTVTNTSIGGQITITFTASAIPAVNESIVVSGVRASVVGRATGFVQTAQFTAAPSGSSNFIVTSSPSVALVVDNFSLAGDPVGQKVPKCSPGDAAAFEFDIEEESLTTWVQYTGGTLTPLNPRSPFGGNANSQVRIAFTGLPTGVTIDWPDEVQSADAGIDSRLTLVSASGTGNSEAIYGFSTADQAASDNTLENFHFTLFFDSAVDDDEDELDGEGEIAAISTAALGTSSLVAQMYPNNSVTTTFPRFTDEEKTEDGFQIVECVTNLLFPWIGSQNAIGYETGFAIANTGYDVGALVPASAGDDGVIRLYFYPQTNGADQIPPTPITTAVLKPGDTYANTIGALGITKFGYMIAVCEFRFGHGFAFITHAGPTGLDLAQGYLALVLGTGAGTGARAFPESLGE